MNQPLAYVHPGAKIAKNVVIEPFTTIHNNVKIGEGTWIGSNVTIMEGARIGKNCNIFPGAVISAVPQDLKYNDEDTTVEIGDNVTIHAGTVLGADAFYYKKRPEGFDKLISGGRVVLEDNVDIGALCTIDKGVSGDTTIGYGTKLDNQVHVGHDTVIGKKCLIASQTGIAGCVIIEDEVTLWGQVGTNSGITIGAKAVIMGQTGVTKSVKGGKSYFGTPIEESREKLKQLAYLKQIPEIIKKIDKK